MVAFSKVSRDYGRALASVNKAKRLDRVSNGCMSLSVAFLE